MDKTVIAYKLGKNRANVLNNVFWAMINFGMALFVPGNNFPSVLSFMFGCLCVGIAFSLHSSNKKIAAASNLDEDYLNEKFEPTGPQ